MGDFHFLTARFDASEADSWHNSEDPPNDGCSRLKYVMRPLLVRFYAVPFHE